MAITKVNATAEKNAFENAVYGKDVRSSLVSLTDKLVSAVNNNSDEVETTLEDLDNQIQEASGIQSTLTETITSANSVKSDLDASVTAAGTANTNLQATITSTNVYSTFNDGAASHNSVYRGKNLGSSVTDKQWAAISSGTFKDLFIGDYWTINSVKWVIAGFDYYYQMGDTSCNTHHAVIIPSGNLYNHVMNDENTTQGGCVGSKMYTEGLEQAKTTIKAAFGERHILSHRIYLCNAVTSGRPSAGLWFDSDVDLMTENMVYGGPVMQQMSYGGTLINNYRCEKMQLPYFRYATHYRGSFWLRDIASASDFCVALNRGVAHAYGASDSIGVRPLFLIS